MAFFVLALHAIIESKNVNHHLRQSVIRKRVSLGKIGKELAQPPGNKQNQPSANVLNSPLCSSSSLPPLAFIKIIVLEERGNYKIEHEVVQTPD